MDSFSGIILFRPGKSSRFQSSCHEPLRAQRDTMGSKIKALDFDSDPADEIIAATSVVHRVPLLTRDRRMRRSKLVPIA